jgi:hypothetical protein
LTVSPIKIKRQSNIRWYIIYLLLLLVIIAAPHPFRV